MLNVLFLILTLVSVGLTVYYGAFYEVSIPGAKYHETYTWLSIGAAIIFAGLFYASRVNRGKARPNVLLE